MDAAFAVPEPARSHAWADIYATCSSIRSGTITIVLDLLRARANDDSPNGPRPLVMDCWTRTHDTPRTDSVLVNGIPTTAGEETFPDKERTSRYTTRDPVGMGLVNNDASAFDGFADLRSWTQKHREKLQGQGSSFLSKDPYSDPDATPISYLAQLLGL